MGAKKIESLTNTWYGFAVFSALVLLLQRGIGLFNLVWGGLGLLVSWFFIYLWGRNLRNRSALTRYFLIAVSGIMTLVDGYGAVQYSWAFVHAWEIKLILAAIYAAVQGWIMAKSFKTLALDSSVQSYFA